MTYTDDGTKVPYDWMPQAMANGIEWATLRKSHKDRFDCLYRRGLRSKALWYLGAFSTLFHRPKWCARAALDQEPGQ